jgi:hypothetical protein
MLRWLAYFAIVLVAMSGHILRAVLHPEPSIALRVASTAFMCLVFVFAIRSRWLHDIESKRR